MDFEKAFAHTVSAKVEGGYSDDPNDRGNWTSGQIGKGELKGTKYGISAMSYPGLDIKNLTLDGAKMIYRRDFWNRVQAAALPAVLRLPVFDMAVNQGPVAAIKTLQRAARVPDDGIIGPKTLNAIGTAEIAELWIRFNGKRLRRYAELLGAEMGLYGEGWFIRAARVAWESLHPDQ